MIQADQTIVELENEKAVAPIPSNVHKPTSPASDPVKPKRSV